MIVIDPGHGGFDPGGGTKDQIKEKDYTLKISKYQADRFKELGIPVALTRETDETLTPSERVKRFNSFFGKDSSIIGISNHINKATGLADGAEVIYSIFDSPQLANSIAANLSDAGQNIRGVYTRKNRAGNDYYFIIRETRPTRTNLIEYGFADSTKDDVEQIIYEWPLLAEAVVKAVVEDLGVVYIPPKYLTYTVKSGDSLYKIAAKYNTTVPIIKNLNDLPSNDIMVGQELLIPYPAETETIHLVKEGETLFKIAQLYNTTVDELMELNELTTDQLIPFQKLKIPGKKETIKSITYTVKPGDSLYKISNKFGVSINSIKETNDLTSDTIYAGQKLKIDLPFELVQYTVVSGDSLWKLSKKFNTTINNIIAYNDLTKTLLDVGDILWVPSV